MARNPRVLFRPGALEHLVAQTKTVDLVHGRHQPAAPLLQRHLFACSVRARGELAQRIGAVEGHRLDLLHGVQFLTVRRQNPVVHSEVARAAHWLAALLVRQGNGHDGILAAAKPCLGHLCLLVGHLQPLVGRPAPQPFGLCAMHHRVELPARLRSVLHFVGDVVVGHVALLELRRRIAWRTPGPFAWLPVEARVLPVRDDAKTMGQFVPVIF